MNTSVNEVTINDVVYVRKDSITTAALPKGNRCVVVVDRGWIWAGDVEEKDGRIYLHRPVWVFRWEGIGFDGVLKDPKSKKVELRKVDVHTVNIPKESEVFRVPVLENWGL